jgi:hypothetical protein
VKVGDQVRDKGTHDTGHVVNVVTFGARTLVCVRMDDPKVALCEELVGLAEDFWPMGQCSVCLRVRYLAEVDETADYKLGVCTQCARERDEGA